MAPAGSFVLLVFEDRLELRRGEARLSTLALNPAYHRPSVVMTRWAVGQKNVRRWEREAREALR